MMTHPDWNYLTDRRFDLRLRVVVNRVYQSERQRIMELREGMVKTASLLAGSAALYKVADPHIVAAAAAVVAIGTTASLVFSWAAKARDAARRSSEWAGIERDMERVGERMFSEPDLNDWAARCNEIEAGEPAPHPVLWERCYRRACLSLGASHTNDGPRALWRPVIALP